MYQESFAQKLKKARTAAGYTQIQTAYETGINRSTIASYEIGRTQPDLETLGILADFYCISVDWLLGTSGGNGKIKQ